MINNILDKKEHKNKKGYLVITRDDGKFFKEYSKKSNHQFYTHKEKNYTKAKESVNNFKKRGIHAKIYNIFIKL